PAPQNAGPRVRERADGSWVVEDASGRQIGPVYASKKEALTNLNAGHTVPAAPPASFANRHWTPAEILEDLRPGDLAKHGDPNKWKFVGVKREPLTQVGAPPGHKKVYEVWEDEFGKKVEWHYELATDGTASVGKLEFPSTTQL